MGNSVSTKASSTTKTTERNFDGTVPWLKQKPESLISQCAMRTGPVKYSKTEDFSYTSTGIVITDVSPYGHITYQSEIGNTSSTLDPRWNDNQWVRAPDSFCSKIKFYQKIMQDLVIKTDSIEIKVGDIVSQGDVIITASHVNQSISNSICKGDIVMSATSVVNKS